MGLTSHDLSYDAHVCPPVTGDMLSLGPLIFSTGFCGLMIGPPRHSLPWKTWSLPSW